MRPVLATVVAGFTLTFASPSPAQAADPDFNRDVRPILAARCFKCHGPDEKARKADLRLDVRDGAVKSGAIAPGKPEASELVRRIVSAEAAEVMPPPAVKNPLSDREKQVLKAWIGAGAKYDPHWAFVPPRRPAVPEIRDPNYVIRNPIDNFVAAKLISEGLPQSAPADRYTLIRRVSLDLIGLPPTPDEVDAFVKDQAPDAYEKVVDRLLASPQYGERWARRWLDLARYADTNGYEKDRARSIWPYRDWVVAALNADMPFDRFTVEQLAGDLLPDATLQQKIATGFHRNTMLNEEGGIDPLEFRYHAVVDRANVTSTVWLGLTMGCAQCHTHKFDPIAHTEYYRFLAFLNNTDEPETEVPTSEMVKKRAEIEGQLRKLEADLPAQLPADRREKLFDAWLAGERKEAVKWVTVRPARLDGGVTKLSVLADGSVLAAGDAMKRDIYTLDLGELPPGVTAFRIEALPHDSLPARGPGRTYYEGPKGDFLLSEFTLTADGKPVKFAGASESYAKLGLINGASSAALAIDGHPHTGWAAAGRVGQESNAVFTLGSPLTAKSATLELLFERHYAASLGHFRISVTTDTRPVKARDVPAGVEDLLLVAPDKLSSGQRDVLLRHWAAVAPELKTARDRLADLRKQLPSAPTTLVMKERPADNRRPTFRHHRGEFLQPKERVEPGGLAVLPPLPKDEPANRLTFARWLVSPGNPLVGRVTVNRQWQAFFGRGIVRTTEDFGYQGEPPTHPELLDWLAVEFVNPSPESSAPPSFPGKGVGGLGSPWSLKRLHRLIVTSATYRQSSRVTSEQIAKDPDDKLLARGPRVRLEAEQIRDSLLKVSGLLSTKMGGPGVFPPQPPGVTTEGTYGQLNWKVSDGEDRYRRGLYTYTKRTAPYAMFGTFDGPSGEACLARREVSNTPLQALTMLNDAVLTDCTRAIGRRAVGREGTVEERAAFLFRICLARPPKPDELALLTQFYETQKTRFAADPARADAVAGPGDGSGTERAAWAAVARAILNLDEFVTRE
ncbi:MAG: Planctomycete cytochrome [Gemmataceae bacterium]|nr:Planctomycete cytochrome [Gemmataceae bacterium]